MYPRNNNFGGNNRSFGGPVLPFILGGVVGSLWSNNHNNNNNFVAYPVYPWQWQWQWQNPMFFQPRFF